MKAQERDQLFWSLKSRFEKNLRRHQGHTWEKVQARIESSPAALKSLHAMESSGGEPDVIGYDESSGQLKILRKGLAKVLSADDIIRLL